MGVIEKIHWFPRHMSVQLKRMEGKLRTIDLIIEVHDARVALTGRNEIFGEKLYAVRPHILVLNKMDLIDLKKYKTPIEDFYRSKGIENIVWTNCKMRISKALTDLNKIMLNCLHGEHRFNRTVKTEYQAMIVGIPNVGKSSLINSLRHNNLGFKPAVAEGARPGVTVRVQNRVRLSDKPPIYVLDTPGVLNPFIKNVEDSMKLALCNLILESATKPHFVADFFLKFMNKHEDYSYVKEFELTNGPLNDLSKLLINICQNKNLRKKTYIGSVLEERWDFDSALSIFINFYRSKKISDCFLDRDKL